MDKIARLGLIAAVAAVALLVPTRAASQTPPPVIEVAVSLTDLPPAVVNVSVPEPAAVEFPELPAPIVNVDVTLPEGLTQPSTVIVEPAPVLPAEIVYQDRTVEVERIVEVPACLDYSDLPHFDLANALTAAFPGALWSLNGSHYSGLTWRDDSPQPDMTAIIGGWLTHLSADC